MVFGARIGWSPDPLLAPALPLTTALICQLPTQGYSLHEDVCLATERPVILQARALSSKVGAGQRLHQKSLFPRRNGVATAGKWGLQR